MPDKTVTVNAYHPYPAFYWEFKLAGGVAADIEGYDAYINADNSDESYGQGTKRCNINATVDDVGSIRCTVGPESAGVPTPGAEGTVTTDWIPVSVGALTWAVDPVGKTEVIQAQVVAGFSHTFDIDTGPFNFARDGAVVVPGEEGNLNVVAGNGPAYYGMRLVENLAISLDTQVFCNDALCSVLGIS